MPTNGKISHHFPSIHFQPNHLQVTFRFRLNGRVVDQPPPAWFPTKKNIGSHAEIGRHVEFLVNEGDPLLQRILHPGNLHRLSLYQDLSLIRRLNPCQDFHESAFPRSVFSQNSQNLSPTQLQAHLVQRAHPRKTFSHGTDFQERI